MADIAKCTGKDCPKYVRESCYRFTASASEFQAFAEFDTARQRNVQKGLLKDSEPCEYFVGAL